MVLSLLLVTSGIWDGKGDAAVVGGDDWAHDRHDVEVMDKTGRVLATARLPEGAAGMARLHERPLQGAVTVAARALFCPAE